MVFCSIDWKGSKHGVDENNLLCCLSVTIPGVSSRRRFESPAFFFLSPLRILVLFIFTFLRYWVSWFGVFFSVLEFHLDGLQKVFDDLLSQCCVCVCGQGESTRPGNLSIDLGC